MGERCRSVRVGREVLEVESGDRGSKKVGSGV